MKWMEIAWANSGIVETAGAGATPEIIAHFQRVGRGDVRSDEVPWCAAFAGSCLTAGGVDISAIPRARVLLARAYLDVGVPLIEPRVGAVCVVTRANAGPEAGHVGFVTGWTDTHVMLLGGNQSNAVTVAPFRRADILGLRWPGAAATAADLAKDGSRIAAAAQRQKADGAKSGSTLTTTQVVPAQPTGRSLEQINEVAAKAEGLGAALLKLEGFLTFAAGKWPWIAGALATFWVGRMIYDSVLISRARAEDHNTGAHVGRQPAPEAAYDSFAL